jgi:transglutaminase-like putative cysteine protease
MVALVRAQGIPCRYVSGYVHHGENSQDRSIEGASHAWVEAYLPGLGWTGFDTTNDVIAQSRHIRVAIGRDYGDAPPPANWPSRFPCCGPKRRLNTRIFCASSGRWRRSRNPT